MSKNRFPQPFRYPGGKYYAIDLLRSFWDNVKHTEYREPFVGGGSIFFNKDKVKVNWINDLDDELIITYQVLQCPDLRQKLLARISGEVANKNRWREIMDFQPETKLDIAFKYYYLNRTSFSGKLVSPGWGYRPKRSLPPERWHERIIPAGKKLEGVRCTNLDFEDVIRRKSSEEVLMYIDPPYYGPPKHKHYRHDFDPEDHIRLCEALKQTNYKFFLTYDDHDFIRELYSWANLQELEFFYRVGDSNTKNGSRKMGFELIITNFSIIRQKEMF